MIMVEPLTFFKALISYVNRTVRLLQARLQYRIPWLGGRLDHFSAGEELDIVLGYIDHMFTF